MQSEELHESELIAKKRWQRILGWMDGWMDGYRVIRLLDLASHYF